MADAFAYTVNLNLQKHVPSQFCETLQLQREFQ
jgi:hypothetical protein